MKVLLVKLLALAWIVLPTHALAEFPDHAVHLVIPFPPGGSYDVIGRAVSQQLALKWKQPVVIENVSGAGGNVGARKVASANPDGYTLLFWGDGLLTNPLLYSNPPFEAAKDFSGVSLVASAPQVLVANTKTQLDSLASILKASKPLTYGTAGNGTPGHLAGELLKVKGPAKLEHVPYRGGSPALTDLMGGQIDLVYTGLPACIGYIKGGTIKAIAVSSKQRSPSLPSVPSVGDSIQGYDVDTWYGVVAPKNTPMAIRQKIASDIKEILAMPSVHSNLVQSGFAPIGAGPEQLDQKLSDDLPAWRQMVKDANAHVD